MPLTGRLTGRLIGRLTGSGTGRWAGTGTGRWAGMGTGRWAGMGTGRWADTVRRAGAGAQPEATVTGTLTGTGRQGGKCGLEGRRVQ